MQYCNLALCLFLTLRTVTGTTLQGEYRLVVRQVSTISDFPIFTTESIATSSSIAAGLSKINSQATSITPTPSSTRQISSRTDDFIYSQASVSTQIISTTVNTSLPGATASASATTSTTAETFASKDDLPITPHLTPALSVSGVIPILTGIFYAIIGVKSRWVQIFLSTAYLASLSTSVLIVYVINPPINDAIQGAYLIGVLMTGLIFGGGALIFKDITEGLGCLLGGFSLGMWFLTLKSGGLVTSQGGKGIFVAVFCVSTWATSWSHYTRPYGLIGSTSFAGSTAFMLGVDCFSRGGLKEFWLYVWDLNDDLFPLNTDTYPITKGIRVETIVIVLGCIIGIISQIRLWKLVSERQKQRELIKLEDERRRNVVEEALGRHLELHNDRNRLAWEKQYGDRLQAKRNTILWSEGHGEKRKSSVLEYDQSGRQLSSPDCVEIGQVYSRNSRSMHDLENKEQSTTTITAIREAEENEHGAAQVESLGVSFSVEKDAKQTDNSEATTDAQSGVSAIIQNHLEVLCSDELPQPADSFLQKPGAQTPSDKESTVRIRQPDTEAQEHSKRKSIQSINRRSLQSIFSHLPKHRDMSSNHRSFSQSQEALVVPNLSLPHTRASSLAATWDEENESLEMPEIDAEISQIHRPPRIVISPVTINTPDAQLGDDIHGLPSSPSALFESSELDPEELIRPPTAMQHEPAKSNSDRSAGSCKATGGNEPPFEDIRGSEDAGGQSSGSESLTNQIPSHLSNSVLSYKTNEWAKHISIADAPLGEEPVSVDETDTEMPTHLVDPKSRMNSTFHNLPAATKESLELPPPIAIVASSTGVKTNSPSRSPLAPALRTRSAVDRSSTSPPSLRSSSTPVVRHSVKSTVIEENNIASFGLQKVPNRLPTVVRSLSPILSTAGTDYPSALQRSASPVDQTRFERSGSRVSHYQQGLNRYSPQLVLASSALSNYQVDQTRSSSALSDHQPNQIRSSSALSNHDSQRSGLRSETRLSNYTISNQPQPTHSSSTPQRRETLLAEWRASNHHASTTPKEQVDNSRAQMMLNRDHERIRREHEASVRAQKEWEFDRSMRTQSMMDAHREVMRKMQSKANAKLTG